MVCDHELAFLKESSIWLIKGNIKPRDEGVYSFLQNRNVFFGEKVKCLHCKADLKTVDHLATKCGRMIEHDYTRRYNEVLKSIHLILCRRFGTKKTRKLKSHSVQEGVTNDKVEIRVDIRLILKHNTIDQIYLYMIKRRMK